MWYHKENKTRKWNDRPTSKGYEPYKHEGRKADNDVKFCDDCNSCWEIDQALTRYKKDWIVCYHYEDFPKRGKEHETCPNCKGLSVK